MFPTQRLFSSILCPSHTSCKLNPCLFSHNESTRPTVLVAIPAASITTKKRIVTSDTAIAGPSKLPKQERRVETNPVPGPSKLPAASYEVRFFPSPFHALELTFILTMSSWLHDSLWAISTPPTRATQFAIRCS
jgi:hypothetical protein